MNNRAIILTACLLAGCAQADFNDLPEAGAENSGQSPQRVIINFSKTPLPDEMEIDAVVARACKCLPVFVRQYRDDALIYSISLPLGLDFIGFKRELVASGVALNIFSVERDTQMRPQ